MPVVATHAYYPPARPLRGLPPTDACAVWRSVKMARMTALDTATIHGRRVAYRKAGEGSAVLLVHGLGGSSGHWRAVFEPLAAGHTVIAPDLPGHGGSDLGPGDYSVGNLASTLRDLLLLLGHRRATIVGHSLGGGVAMQFIYQFPELSERLVLLASGGLGPEVSPLLRAAALPGAGSLIAATAPLARIVRRARVQRALRGRLSTDVAEIVYGYGQLADPRHRAAFLDTVRSGLGFGGQRVSAIDRLYLAEALPVLIAWGGNDPLVPVHHAFHAQRGIPGARLEVFDGVGHIPQLEAPGLFLSALRRFLDETAPADFDPADWQRRLEAGAS